MGTRFALGRHRQELCCPGGNHDDGDSIGFIDAISEGGTGLVDQSLVGAANGQRGRR
jgi:hypothetical protein